MLLGKIDLNRSIAGKTRSYDAPESDRWLSMHSP
jgi:hypothetical protein